MHPEPQLASCQEVADALGVSPYSVGRWCREGLLKAVKLRKEWRIPRAELERVLAQGLQ